ncbi:MAG: DUF2975 domain-containing protein [Defluviitaleaceae bacterium]|nr:DUF2975 domain-containing protein [Defluviitaleaceae bacterium]
MGKRFDMERLALGLRLVLQATFAAGLFITIFLSFIIRRFFDWYFGAGVYYWASLAVLTVSGIFALIILWQLIGLLKTVNNRNPFVRKNVAGLRRISASCFIIAVLFLVLAFFRISALTILVCYMFFIGGFFCVILSGLFAKAIAYKDENDLTV